MYNKIIHEARLDEIRACIREQYPESINTETLENPINYLENRRAKNNHTLGDSSIEIVASYDMSWSIRSSGRHYDSMKGHGFLIGGIKKNIIAMGVIKKKCRIYIKSSREENELPVHLYLYSEAFWQFRRYGKQPSPKAHKRNT